MEEFFTPRRRPGRPRVARPKTRGPRPSHYKVISISLYTEDLDRLESHVEALKGRGCTRASKSMVIREALRQFAAELVPEQR